MLRDQDREEDRATVSGEVERAARPRDLRRGQPGRGGASLVEEGQVDEGIRQRGKPDAVSGGEGAEDQTARLVAPKSRGRSSREFAGRSRFDRFDIGDEYYSFLHSFLSSRFQQDEEAAEVSGAAAAAAAEVSGAAGRKAAVAG